jgi:hypothetical protein
LGLGLESPKGYLPGGRAGSEELRVGRDRKLLERRESSMGARERGGSFMTRST